MKRALLVSAVVGLLLAVACSGGDGSTADVVRIPEQGTPVSLDCDSGSTVAGQFDLKILEHEQRAESCAYWDTTGEEVTFEASFEAHRFPTAADARDWMRETDANQDDCDEPNACTGSDELITVRHISSAQSRFDTRSGEDVPGNVNHQVHVREGRFVCSAEVLVASTDEELYGPTEAGAVDQAFAFCGQLAAA